MASKLLTIGSLLLLAGFSGLVSAPRAAAHTCQSDLPDCGPCLSGTHEHYWDLGVMMILFCMRTEGPGSGTAHVESPWGLVLELVAWPSQVTGP